jgi:hypothetical protein
MNIKQIVAREEDGRLFVLTEDNRLLEGTPTNTLGEFRWKEIGEFVHHKETASE